MQERYLTLKEVKEIVDTTFDKFGNEKTLLTKTDLITHNDKNIEETKHHELKALKRKIDKLSNTEIDLLMVVLSTMNSFPDTPNMNDNSYETVVLWADHVCLLQILLCENMSNLEIVNITYREIYPMVKDRYSRRRS